MRRGVIIIIVGVLLIALTAVAYLYLTGGLGGAGGREPTTAGEEEPRVTAVPSPTPVLMLPVVVAVQEIPRGAVIERDASGNYPVTLQDWPVDVLPPGAIIAGRPGDVSPGMLPPGAVIGGPAEDLDGDSFPDVYDYVVGKQLRTSTVLFEPILDNMLNEKGRIHLSGEGSDVALAAPRDRVVIAYPLPSIEDDPTAAVAYALRPGDHVDMIVSLALVDLDEDFHTILPNTTQLLDFAEGGDGGEGETLRLVEFPTGRIEQGPLGLTFNIIPSEDEQRSRVVTQLTVQDVIVMRVGRYPTLEEEILGIDMQVRPEPTATPAVVATPEATPVPQPQQQGQQQQAEEAPTPTPEPPMPEVIVLAVSPQEALVISFAWQINAKVSFALRAVGDEGVFFTTNSVTLQYLMEQYNIAVPPKMQYGIQPPVGTVQEFVAGGGE
jgi:Flp pilus assembly protein CpaB